MADYRLFVSVNPQGFVSVRGGKRPTTYYRGNQSWNGEAHKVQGIWHVDCGDGREFDIINPPYWSGSWSYQGKLTTAPPDGFKQEYPKAEKKTAPAKPKPKPKPKPKGVTLEELLAEDD